MFMTAVTCSADSLLHRTHFPGKFLPQWEQNAAIFHGPASVPFDHDEKSNAWQEDGCQSDSLLVQLDLNCCDAGNVSQFHQ
jgi:hypothetical protein